MDKNNWSKLARVMKRAGAEVCYPAACLWYVAIDPETPVKIRVAAFGPLAYLASPLDAIPDLTPVVGYTDDAAVIAGVVVALAAFIKSRHKLKAKDLATRWFGREATEAIENFEEEHGL